MFAGSLHSKSKYRMVEGPTLTSTIQPVRIKCAFDLR